LKLPHENKPACLPCSLIDIAARYSKQSSCAFFQSVFPSMSASGQSSRLVAPLSVLHHALRGAATPASANWNEQCSLARGVSPSEKSARAASALCSNFLRGSFLRAPSACAALGRTVRRLSEIIYTFSITLLPTLQVSGASAPRSSPAAECARRRDSEPRGRFHANMPIICH
jgi:hypothetical protein